ncbi:kinesin-like protein KIF28P [Trichonephila clavipes]|nr:kinesin-like protein KIF28P [Trichonephila clavipes]
MSGNTTFLTNPDDPSDPVKKFTYDHSYWSHDGFKELPNGYCTQDPTQPNGAKFCDQERVYGDLGRGVLRNAWDGYNSALFAYGQTGSGKSWSVIGYGANRGIVPKFCEEMFRGIEDKRRSGDNTTEFEVSIILSFHKTNSRKGEVDIFEKYFGRDSILSNSESAKTSTFSLP